MASNQTLSSGQQGSFTSEAVAKPFGEPPASLAVSLASAEQMLTGSNDTARIEIDDAVLEVTFGQVASSSKALKAKYHPNWPYQTPCGLIECFRMPLQDFAACPKQCKYHSPQKQLLYRSGGSVYAAMTFARSGSVPGQAICQNRAPKTAPSASSRVLPMLANPATVTAAASLLPARATASKGTGSSSPLLQRDERNFMTK